MFWRWGWECRGVREQVRGLSDWLDSGYGSVMAGGFPFGYWMLVWGIVDRMVLYLVYFGVYELGFLRGFLNVFDK